MNPEIKKLWVEALRSGKYRQTTGSLRRGNDAFCCLGVLCDLYREVTPRAKWDRLDLFVGAKEADRCYGGYLPPEVVRWSGLGDVDPVVNGTELSGHNDCGATFEEIADLIEAHL